MKKSVLFIILLLCSFSIILTACGNTVEADSSSALPPNHKYVSEKQENTQPIVIENDSSRKSSSSTMNANLTKTTSSHTLKLLDVPLIKQRPELPSGCEAVALTMALRYYGINIDKAKIASQMPRDNTPLTKNADGTVKTWGDPEVGFIGDPYGAGITINPNPLKQVLDRYRSDGLALYGKDFSVIQDYVAKGKPVLVWFTITHELPTPRVWVTPDGKRISSPRPLHCIVVTGADNDWVYFNDSESTPLSGKNVKVKKDKFIQIYNAMGRRALVVN
ncbi:MAG: C39 family peptidase [Sporolactobacillus sp.]